MKIRSVIALVGLAISFAMPTFAQEQNTVDPEVRQQIEALSVKFAEAYNNHDAAAIAGLYTENAIEFRAWEKASGVAHSGRQAIEKMFALQFPNNYPKLVNELVQLYPIGNSDVCAIIDETIGSYKNRLVKIYVRDADTWKIRMTFAAANPL